MWKFFPTTVLVLSISMSAASGQTQETCVEYMEATAEYNAILEHHISLVNAAYQQAHRAFKDRESEIYRKRREQKATDGASWIEANRTWSRELEEARQELENDPSLLKARNEGTIAVNNAVVALRASIRNAYKGPESEIDEVLWRLIDQDLTRCSDNGFPIQFRSWHYH